ncbi:hypothetical protein BDQ17DRAFT_1334848 [Cyathus striatus]|nr:hypothetical protein BDQ17DRAFT_1334848 [Cyathus striatus]
MLQEFQPLKVNEKRPGVGPKERFNLEWIQRAGVGKHYQTGPAFARDYIVSDSVTVTFLVSGLRDLAELHPYSILSSPVEPAHPLAIFFSASGLSFNHVDPTCNMPAVPKKVCKTTGCPVGSVKAKVGSGVWVRIQFVIVEYLFFSTFSFVSVVGEAPTHSQRLSTVHSLAVLYLTVRVAVLYLTVREVSEALQSAPSYIFEEDDSIGDGDAGAKSSLLRKNVNHFSRWEGFNWVLHVSTEEALSRLGVPSQRQNMRVVETSVRLGYSKEWMM